MLELTSFVKDELFPDFPVKELSAFSARVSKSSSGHLRDVDIVHLIFSAVSDKVAAKYEEGSNLSGQLNNLLDKKELEAVSDNVCAILDGLPYQYVLYFPICNIPGFSKDKVYKLSDRIFLRSMSKSVFTPLRTRIQSKEQYVHLGIHVAGFIQGSLDSIAGEEAISFLKQGLQLGLMLNLLEKKKVDLYKYGLYGELHNIPDTKILISRSGEGEGLEHQVLAPLYLSKQLNSFAISEKLIQAIEVDDQVPGYQFIWFNKLLGLPRNNNTTSIMAALEWLFDSSIAENETVSFLQICIALECVLGKGAPAENLTATLADRCAYLLGKTADEREKLRKNFKKLYSIRSGVVHGREQRLVKPEEKTFHKWGEHILNAVLRKEISLLLE